MDKKPENKKKRIAITSVSLLLVVAVVASAATLGATALTYYSFEYIEKLKNQYQNSPMQIMEIAPSENNGIFGYLVEGSEPVKDWKNVAAMYNKKTSRENYVTNLFSNLQSAGIMSPTADAAPLQLLEDYRECYPWDKESNPDLTEVLALQYPEKTFVNGKMEYTPNSDGEYDADFSYSLESESYKNNFNFNKFKDKLINKSNLKELSPTKGLANNASKVMALDLINRSVVVFGSTESNWSENANYDNYFDLSAVYKSKNYYTVDELEAGKTYCLSFESSVKNGKGQVTIIPYTSANKNVYYNPNYSNQYWYWSTYFEGTTDGNPLTYQFTIPEGSNIDKVQIRYDISAPETLIKVRNISVYEFTPEGNLFNINNYKGTNATVNATNHTVAVSTEANTEKFVSYPTTKGSANSYYTVDPAQLYTFTYHVENSGGGSSRVQIMAYDESGNFVKELLTDPAEIYQTGSGTYAVNVMTESGIGYLGVSFGAKSTSNKKVNIVYSNASLTHYKDYISTGSATHVQVYDHFSTGSPQYSLGMENIFSFDKWYASGSNSIKFTDKPGSITSYENGIITLNAGTYRDQATNYSNGSFVASDLLYYIPIEKNSYYRLSLRPTSDKDTRFTIYYYNADRQYISKADYSKTISTSSLNENGIFSDIFRAPDNAEYMQISFGVTAANQKATFDNISIYDWTIPKSYFYSLTFTEVSDFSALNNIESGTPLYTVTDFAPAGVSGEFDIDPVKSYYKLNEYSGIYERVSFPVDDGIQLYLPGPYYVWEGNYGSPDFFVNESVRYYTAEINTSGFIRATANNISNNAVLYTFDGSNYNIAGIYPNISLDSGEYYIQAAPVSESFDSVHPYYLVEGDFREAEEGEQAFFIPELNKYVYVGNGGDYNFARGDEELTIETSTIFYKGEFKNNNWFKRFVMDCDREDPEEMQAELDRFNVNVITYTPNYLNLLDYSDSAQVTDLGNALLNFELCVFSSGYDINKNMPASYENDFTPTVKRVLSERILLSDDADKEFLPVAVDLKLLNANKPNIKSLATDICTDTGVDASGRETSNINREGGVKNYIYRFDGSDIAPAIKYITNSRFIDDIDAEERGYEKEDSNYNEVWNAIAYENTLRNARKKYHPLDNFVSEATIIRHILNYRGMRSVNSKAVIKILEIEPSSSDSVLYSTQSEKTAKKIIDVRRWFSTAANFDSLEEEQKNISYTYTDSEGNDVVGTTRFEITTMAPHELSGKIEDLAEIYDLVYVGTSLDGFEKEPITITEGEDKGDVVPNYNDNTLDGFFYTNTGDKYETAGEGLLDRSSVGGLVYDDYNTNNALALFGMKPEKRPWYVNASSATFRDAGNDITDTKMQQLQQFINNGLPVIVSDALCLQDFDEELRVKVMGKTYYQRAGRTVYLPGFEGNSEYSFTASDNVVHVVLTAQVVGELPEGTKTSFQWYYDNGDGVAHKINMENTKNLSFAWFRKLIGKEYTTQVENKDYVSIDTNGDGTADLFCLDFEPKDYTQNGDYYCTVNYDFSECKNSLGATLKYNGLYGNSAKQDVTSNRIHVSPENRTYTIQYFDTGDNPAYRDMLGSYVNSVHYSANKTFNVDSDMCMFGAITPIPAEANDYVAYRATVRNTDTTGASAYDWSELIADWERFGGSEAWNPSENAPFHYRGNPGNRRQMDIYMRITHTTAKDGKRYEVCSYVDSGEGGGQKMKNKGFSFYFNVPSDDITDSKYRVSAGGYGRFKDTYTDLDTRTYTVSGFKLYLKDANGNKITSADGYVDVNGGYTITGLDTNGNDITGAPTRISTRADIRENRIDNCSNMYDFLTTSIRSLRNVMTQNQVERSDNMYRELLNMYVNLSEPQIEFVKGKEPIEYPNNLVNGTIDVSFKVTNETDVDTINTRYNCQLFIDDNGDGQYAPTEIVDCSISGGDDNGVGGLKTSSDANGEFIYQLVYKFPKGETGIKPWRLKVTKIGEEGAHTSYTGYSFVKATIRGEEIKAIQILPGDWDPDYLANVKANYFYKGEKDNPYFGNLYKGSVFLSDVYVSDELIYMNDGKSMNGYTFSKDNPDDPKLTRTIYYKDGTYSEPNAKFEFVRGRSVDHVEFLVANDYKLDIYFTCTEDVNNNKDGILDRLETDYDMWILGYGDLYGKMGLGKTQSSIDLAETTGFNEGTALALERLINAGQPVLFCHDTITSNVNLVNYWANDVLSFGNDAANTIANAWNDFKSGFASIFNGIFGTNLDESKHAVYNAEIHTSRVKQGYYTNLILREPLGQDRYGITSRIKQRALYTYNDEHLKLGHMYNNIYEDTKENGGVQSNSGFWYYDEDGKEAQASGYNEWKAIYRSLKSDDERAAFAALAKSKGNESKTSYNILMMEESGFSIAWHPGSNKTVTDCFAHGFTSYSVHRFAKGDLGTTDTDRVSQVNEGQITYYPYIVNVEDMYARDETGKQAVMKTHEQYFQVNLNENENGEIATVWFNLAPGTGSYSSSYTGIRNNCEDAYYLYTKGNVCYTGAGHTNGFTPFEAKLFFNAIIASGRTEGKRPTVSFYASPSDLDPLSNIAFVSTEDSTPDVAEGYYSKDDTVIWRNPVYFKISNSAASLIEDVKREVKFYMDDPSGSGEKVEITDSVAVKDGGGSSVQKNNIVPGTYYELQVPDVVFDNMVDENGNLVKINTSIYVEVVLTADELEIGVEEEEVPEGTEVPEEEELYAQSETAELQISLTDLFSLG